MGSVDANNQPNVSPIGSFFLNGNQTRFYFEKFPRKLPVNIKSNNHICFLAVNSSTWLWLRSLMFGKFSRYPAMQLYATAGDLRKSTDVERSRLHRRMRLTSGFSGNKYLWSDMEMVRDVAFSRAEKINLGKMTDHLA